MIGTLPDLEKPFFAYGLFKQEHPPYRTIEGLVFSVAEAEVKGFVYERDGYPLIVAEDNGVRIKGQLISFRSGAAKEAFETITSFEPSHYSWSTCNALGDENSLYCNYLTVKYPKKGTSTIEVHDEPYEWKLLDDPMFGAGLDYVEGVVLSSEQNIYRNLGTYMLLWSIIERYLELCYGASETKGQLIKRLVEDRNKEIRGYLKSTECIKEQRHNHVVTRSSDPSTKYKLNIDNPQKALEYYYYGARSNAVHRGKVAHSDFNTVRDCLTEVFYLGFALIRGSVPGRSEQITGS
jgi:hypothetical protein